MALLDKFDSKIIIQCIVIMDIDIELFILIHLKRDYEDLIEIKIFRIQQLHY